MKTTLRLAGPWRQFVLVALVAAFTLAAYAALTRHGGRVIDVVVEIQPTPDGLTFIQGVDVQRRLDSGSDGALIGQVTKDLDLEQLELFLEEDPFVSQADLYVSFDGSLHVSIVQNEPLLRVHHRTGSDYYLGPKGEILPLSKHSVARVPVLTGDVRPFKLAVRDSVAMEVYRLAVALSKDELYHPLIEQIEVRNGSYTLVPKFGTASVTLGSLDHLEEKLARFKTYLKVGAPEVGWEVYENIDLSYAKQVICRKRKPNA